MYKAIISDLDGTLFDEKSMISPYTAQVLRAAAAQGIRIILATAATTPTCK